LSSPIAYEVRREVVRSSARCLAEVRPHPSRDKALDRGTALPGSPFSELGQLSLGQLTRSLYFDRFLKFLGADMNGVEESRMRSCGAQATVLRGTQTQNLAHDLPPGCRLPSLSSFLRAHGRFDAPDIRAWGACIASPKGPDHATGR